MQDYIQESFDTTLTQFINEIDLSFDYLDPEVLENAKKEIEDIKSGNETILNKVFEALKPFENDLYFIVSATQKYKSDRLNFLNEITVFGIDFSLFKDENKNTKKSLVKYLYQIYMSVFFIKITESTNSDENLDLGLERFVEQMQAMQLAEMEANKPKERSVVKGKRIPQGIPQGIPHGIPSDFKLPPGFKMPKGLSGMEGVLNKLMQNEQIMSLATEVSEQIKTENMNPMAMLSGIINGKMDPRLNNLMTQIQEKVETKMQSGEIDKTLFEEQAKELFDNVQM